ncbi:flavocytochrome c [Marinilactibacillus psychrotolerans]|uniref:flavocytochrome c n=1 Tax=Marinilactibacillus psychrotolerans TaxID=191770 RepID=UPI003887BDB1
MQVIQNDKVDIVVVGAGGAGMAAAISAKLSGANVVLVEQLNEIKGNTIKSSAGMNASESKFQSKQNVEDSNECFFQETYKGGNQANDKELLKYFVNHSADAIDWLDGLGITLSDLTKTGGMSVNRTHRPADGSAIGQYLVSGLLKKIKELNIPILFQSKAEKLLVKNSKIVGVQIEDNLKEKKKILADCVIVTTGGFGANKVLLQKYAPQLDGIITTNHPGTQGSGIQMIQAIGGAVRDLNQVQIHPTVHQETGILVTEALRGEGALLVNKWGNRFVEELDRRDVVSDAILKLEEPYAYLIFNNKIRKRVPAVSFYEYKKMVYSKGSIKELAQYLKMTENNLKQSVKVWNVPPVSQSVREGATETPMNGGPYFAIKIAPGIHHTMGGVKINIHAEVLNKNGESIKGLYAAGETVGGLHGQNRIGGNAIAETIVFGRTAGDKAAEYSKKKHRVSFEQDSWK